MGKHFFDYEDDDFACSISDNIAIDSDGDLLIRMGDDMAMDMDLESCTLYPVGPTMKMTIKIMAAERRWVPLPPCPHIPINLFSSTGKMKLGK